VGPKGQPFLDCMMGSEKEKPTIYWVLWWKYWWLKQLSHPTPSNNPFRLVGSIFLPNPMTYALCFYFLFFSQGWISYIIYINFVAYIHHSVKGNNYANKGAAHLSILY